MSARLVPANCAPRLATKLPASAVNTRRIGARRGNRARPGSDVDGGGCVHGGLRCAGSAHRAMPYFDCDGVARRRRGERQLRRHRLARALERVPVGDVGQGGDRHRLRPAPGRPAPRRPCPVADITISCGRFSHRHAGHVPEIGGGGARQHGLHAHALVGQFVLQRLREREHEGLAAAVHAVEQFRRDGDDRGDVDDRAVAARDERRRGRIGQSREDIDVERDHALHVADVGLQQRRGRTDAGVVDQQGDAGVAASARSRPWPDRPDRSGRRRSFRPSGPCASVRSSASARSLSARRATRIRS